MSGSSLLSTKSAYFPADESLDLPGIVVQVIAGVDSYLVWAGATSQIPLSGNKAREAEIEALLQRGRLGYDWACSMGNVKVWQALTCLESEINESNRHQYLYQALPCCERARTA